MFEINVYKYDDCWWFDDPNKGIFKEELVMGAPEFIENFLLNGNKSKFDLIFSDMNFNGNEFQLTFDRFEESGYVYKFINDDIWLCSVLVQYYENPPTNLYLKVK